MASIQAYIGPPVYEFESTGGSQFGIVALGVIDLARPDQDALAEVIRDFLESLPGVNGVSVKKTDRVETFI
jgi:hypothetical protein